MIIHRGPFVGVLSFEWYMITEYPQTWPMFPEETKHILILAPTDCKISRLAWTEKNVLPLVNSAKRYSESFAAYCNNFCSRIYIYIYIYIIYKTSLMQPLIAFCAFLAWFLSRAVSTLRLLSGVSFIRKNIWQLSDCKANNLSSTFFNFGNFSSKVSDLVILKLRQ